MFGIKDAWRSYTIVEKKNMALYIGGIMFYKVGLEVFIGSMQTLASDRFGYDAFEKMGAAGGVNQAAQCVGAILIAPLIRRWRIRTVLTGAILTFALMTVILLIVDASSGGQMKTKQETQPHYGNWPPNVIFLVWTMAGIAYGMVELIRRVIPAEIVGGHVGKLRRMDAMVHIFYETAGTGGALASSAAISAWGNNYSFMLTPIFFVLAGGTWVLISILRDDDPDGLRQLDRPDSNCLIYYLVQVVHDVGHFFRSIWIGMKLVLGTRRFIWLWPCYSLAIYLHRFLENIIGTIFAKRVLGISAWAQIIVGESNFGELCGALAVFVFSDYVTTPLVWLRLDALMLNLAWLIPFLARRSKPTVAWAWMTGLVLAPMSFGWASGDVSLAAYIQASLVHMEYAQSGFYTLGSVMAFLYSSYIVMYAILSATLGGIVDKEFKGRHHVERALDRIAGEQFTACFAIIFLATFIPIGAFHLNPKRIGDFKLQGDPADPCAEVEQGVDEMREAGASPIVGDGWMPSTGASRDGRVPSTAEDSRVLDDGRVPSTRTGSTPSTRSTFSV